MNNTTLLKVEQIKENIYTFHFSSENFQKYAAGQYIELVIPHNNPDKRGIKRWFTLSSSPTEQEYALTTKFSGSKASTYKKALFALQAGEKVKMSSPMGDFVLPKDKNINLIFVAGGIGITPFRSMIKWLIDTGQKRQIHLIYAAKQRNQTIFTELFSDYGVKDDTTISGKSGIDNLTDKVLEVFADHSMIFLAGPEKMVEELYNQLQKAGVNRTQIVTDYFPGYTDI